MNQQRMIATLEALCHECKDMRNAGNTGEEYRLVMRAYRELFERYAALFMLPLD